MIALPLNKKASSTMPQEEQHFTQIDDDDIRFLSTQLRGVKQARVRFLAGTPEFQLEVIEVLLALGVSATSERMGMIAPYPKRRFSIRYKGDSAIVTVAQDAELMG
ncbi:hypothetical protein HOY34_10975 [Xinfangfangia sp. D13-10-4-6]|uniref:hypothetical protein n=1 Tax=Pseudogemmobacter hezensis TaxID=2737662 RepID=UPI001556A3B2|nr:hypothetical protein [Pseudogemmobacter hezensis]NPD15724.1 hypothetical protein [Pseudogemmobacter hezensis]